MKKKNKWWKSDVTSGTNRRINRILSLVYHHPETIWIDFEIEVFINWKWLLLAYLLPTTRTYPNFRSIVIDISAKKGGENVINLKY